MFTDKRRYVKKDEIYHKNLVFICVNLWQKLVFNLALILINLPICRR
jgi:hypothetical protein